MHGLAASRRRLTVSPQSEEGPIAWSPDGQRIALLVTDEDKYAAYDQGTLTLVPAAGGAATILTPTLDRRVGRPQWSPDGRFVIFGFEDDRAAVIGRVPASGGAVERLTNGRRVVSDPSMGKDGAVAVLCATPAEPVEVCALENGGALRRLSKQNDALMGELALSTVEDLESRSKDGTLVHGLMNKPATYVAGQKYPTLLFIHGGPNSQDDYAFVFEPELFAANGYVVLQVNYRGSSGRGHGPPEGDLRGLGRQGSDGPAAALSTRRSRWEWPIRTASAWAGGATAAS